MSHLRTVHIHPPSIRKCHSEEHISSLYKAEANLDARGSLPATKTIPSFSKLGKELRIRFESKEDALEQEKEEEEREKEEEEGGVRGQFWKYVNGGKGGIGKKTRGPESGVKIKMSLQDSPSASVPVKELRDAQDAGAKLNERLLRERRVSEAKETTIQNLRHEISLLDEELVNKRKENEKDNEETKKWRSKTTSLQTENKILERQVKMMNDSNKRLHNELHDLRNKLRVQEAKVGELRVQRSDAVRKYAHLLQTSVDKSTRLRFFLQQLQNDILTHDVTAKKFQIQRQALEDLMQEQSQEDLQFKKYGLLSPRKMRKASANLGLSEDEKETLRKDLESVLANRHNKLPDKNFPIEKLATATERLVTEGLKTRLGRENEESSHIHKMVQEAKHQIKGLNRLESSHVEASKRMEGKVGTQLAALEEQLKDLSEELRLAQILKHEDDEKLKSIRKFSTADSKVECLSLGRRASQVEKLEIESAISSMERKTEESSHPLTEVEKELLSLKQKMASTLQEKLVLADEVIESRTGLQNLQSLLESRRLENDKMEKELSNKEKRISQAEESLREAHKETALLKQELETVDNELTKERCEGEKLKEKLNKERPHQSRVELNFTPHTRQPVLEQTVENLNEEICFRKASVSQLTNENPTFKGVDKAVQTGEEAEKSERFRRESPRMRRRSSVDQVDGHFKQERRVSKTELKLVQRVEKGVQADITSNELDETRHDLRHVQILKDKVVDENRELRSVLEEKHREIERLLTEVEDLRHDNRAFNSVKRVSALWKSLEETTKDKEDEEKKNKVLQEELEKQRQEIQELSRDLGHRDRECTLQTEVIESYKEDLLTAHKMANIAEPEVIIAERFPSDCRTLPSDVENGPLEEHTRTEPRGSFHQHTFVFDNEEECLIAEQQLSGVANQREQTISMMESVIERFRKDLASSQEQANVLQLEIHNKDELIKDLRLDITERSRTVAEGAELYNRRVSELKASLDETRKETLIEAEISEVHKSQVDDLKVSLEKTRKESLSASANIERCNLQISRLKAALDDEKKDNRRAVEEIKLHKTRISDLKAELDERMEDKRRTTKEIEQYKSHISSLTTSLELAGKENTRSTEKIQRQKSEMSHLKASLEETRKENQIALEDIRRFKSQLSETKASLEEARRENLTETKNNKLYKSEITDLKTSLEKTRKEHESANTSFQRCNSQISDMKAALDDKKKEYLKKAGEIELKYKTQISDLTSKLGEAKEEARRTSNENKEYKTHISSLKALLENAGKENVTSAEEIEKHRSEMSHLKASLEEGRKETQTKIEEIERFTSQVLNVEASLDEAKKEHRKDIELHKYEVLELKAALDKTSKEHRNAAENVERYKTQVSDLEVRLVKTRQEKHSASEEIERFKSEVSDLKAELQQAGKEKRAKVRENEGLRDELRNREEKVTSLTRNAQKFTQREAEIRLENELLTTANSKLQITVDNLKKQLMGDDKKVGDLANELEQSKRTISGLREELLGIGRLQQEVKGLETKVNVREQSLEQKIEEILEKDKRIEKLVQEMDELERRLQENSSKSEVDCDGHTFDKTDGATLEDGGVDLKRRNVQPTIEDQKNGYEQSSVELQRLQDSFSDLQREKLDLEDTVQQLRGIKNNQEKELELLRKQIEVVENGVYYTEKTLEINAKQMVEKEQELRELVNEKIEKSSQIENLEASLNEVELERKSALEAKGETIDRLKEDNRRLEDEVGTLKMDVQKRILDWEHKSATMEDEIEDVKEKLKESELKYLLTKEEKGKVEKDLKTATERLMDSQLTIREKDEKINKLNAHNFELQTVIREKDDSLHREEKLRMENMKILDSLKIKMEKMEGDDKKQRERLFSLKSACSEANEAYEIVKKQNHELKRDVDQVKKKLTERDFALETSEKEKEKMEEQILNASRTIDDWRKSSRRDDSLSPDSALGISLTSTSDLYSGPNSPNSDVSDNAFSVDGSDEKFGQETGLLCKMPSMVGNLRAVVQENEVLRGKLYEIALHKEKLDGQVRHLSQLNEMLKNDVTVRDKSMSSLEGKIQSLEDDSRGSKGKVVELERSFAVALKEAEYLSETLENRDSDIADLKEKVEIQEEKEKTLELYSKSVAEKFEYESSEKRKYEELSRQLIEENTLHKNQLENIDKKLVAASSNGRDHIYFSARDSVPMATVIDKVDVFLKNKKDLEVLVSNLQAECADLQLANGGLQRDVTRYIEVDREKQDLEAELNASRVRDEQNNAKLQKLAEQKEAIQHENKNMEATIVEHKKKEETLQAKAGTMKQTIQELEKTNESFRAEADDLKDNVRYADEENSKLASELKSFQAKMCEIETTNDAYQAENEKLRTDIMALSEAKCDVELKITEAVRQIKKLNESVEKERAERRIIEAERKEALSTSEGLQNELTKAKTHIATIEDKQTKAEKSMGEMEKSIFDTSSESKRLADKLAVVKKDLTEMEERYKNSIQEEENLQQKLNLTNLELTKLTTAHEGNTKRRSALEKSFVESKGKNEELEMLLEKTRSEKANLLKEGSHKEEVIHDLEAKKKELEDERQNLTNELYISTKKVLSQQQNVEALINEVNLLNRELKGVVRNAFIKEGRSLEDEKSPHGEGESNVVDNEVVLHNLKQSIRATERNLDLVRPEARILEHETKSCLRDVEFVNKEFALLRNQLTTFSSTSHKLCEEIKKLKEDLAQKEALLEETSEQHSNLKEENLESRELIIHLQSKCTELETLFGEYENKAEKMHGEHVRANQQISTLDSNLTRAEQKKICLEKEVLVSQEKMSNLEAIIRAMKDEARNDKKKIATLETEFNEKQALGRELENTEAALRDLRAKYDDVLKEKEEAKTELYGVREEVRQQQVELKNARKEIDNLKKQINSEKGTRQKVEQDLNENTAVCKTFKNNLYDLERSLVKLQDENSDLEEKVSMLETSGNTFRKETELQAIEMKRLEEELRDTKEQYATVSKSHEGSEKERKRLANELLVAEENLSKLQGACEELLKEKEASSGKVLSLNEALEVIISSHEETAANLKQDLMITKKELSVTKSALERRQKQVEDLQDEVQGDELKIKSLEDKKQEVFEKYWASQNDLTEAEGKLDSLRSENKELKERIASSSQRIQHLQETLQSERETNEKEVTAWSDQMNKLKTLHQKVIEERGNFKKDLENTQVSLTRTVDDLKQTSDVLNEKEKAFSDDVVKRDHALEDLSNQNTRLKDDLSKTKDALKNARTHNDDLKERLEITMEKVEVLDKELQQRNTDIEDLLAEAHAKLNVVHKMKATNSGENFAELPFTAFTVGEDEGGADGVDACPVSPRNTSMKDVVVSFHKACLASFKDNRALQQESGVKTQEIERLEENLHKERNNSTEMKRYLHDVEKRKGKLEEEVKRLRRRLEGLKLKSVEMEKDKDNEITDTKGEKVLLEKDLWETREALEESKAKLKSTEEEKERYRKDLEFSRKQIVEAKSDIKGSQQQLDLLQENILQLKRRIFELEANDKTCQQLIHDKEKELSANNSKIEELEKLYDAANEKKTELFAKLSKADERTVNLETDYQDSLVEKATLESQIAALQENVGDKDKRLGSTSEELSDIRERCEELEIQRESLQATKDILKQQLDASKRECVQFEALLEKEKQLSNAFSKQLAEVKSEKDKLERELKEVLEQKENMQQMLSKSEESLKKAGDNVVTSFQEIENLKRQLVKVQSSACADSARKQLEIGKLIAESESLKKELNEREKEHSENVTKWKVTEKENEFLKKDLTEKHARESELKLDLTSTNSKLQSYVIERECWEREVKSVLGEMEQQKNASHTKEEKLERLRTRYENEIKFLQERVGALEREVRIIQEASEQQRHADEIASKLALESKDMEIDNLKLRLQATRIHGSEKGDVLEIMKEQLDERTRQISDLMEQLRVLKESYHLELGSLHADLKCAQMENMLQKRGGMEGGHLGLGHETDLLESIKQSRKESERLRTLLKNKMKEMKSLRKHILTERVSGSRQPGYSMY